MEQEQMTRLILSFWYFALARLEQDDLTAYYKGYYMGQKDLLGDLIDYFRLDVMINQKLKDEKE